MPLARQTSRIVWPSTPSTMRPSISIRKAGVERGRCGAWVVMRRSAGESSYGMTVSYGVLASGRLSTRPACSFQTAFWLAAGRSLRIASAGLLPAASSADVSGAVALAIPVEVWSTGVQSAGLPGVVEGGELGLGRGVGSRMGRLRTRPRRGPLPLAGRPRRGRYCGRCGHRARRGNTGRHSGGRGWPVARGRIARCPRCRRKGRSGARSRRRAAGLRRYGTLISARRRRPIRQGMVLPQASSAQKRVRTAARSTTQVCWSSTTIEPEPT